MNADPTTIHTPLTVDPTVQTTSPSEKGNTMIKLLLTLHLWRIALLDHALDRTLRRANHTLQTARRTGVRGVSLGAGLRSRRQRDERGSVTIEQVIWAGAVIVIVGIVVAAITAYVKSESGKIK